MRGTRYLLLLCPGLLYGSTAFALDVDVGGTDNPCDTSTTPAECDTVAEAIGLVNGQAEASNTIAIDHANYVGGESELPAIEVQVDISSNVAAADFTKTLPPIISTADLDLSGLAVQGGVITNGQLEGWGRPNAGNYGGGCYFGGTSGGCYVGPVWVGADDEGNSSVLTADDVDLGIGPGDGGGLAGVAWSPTEWGVGGIVAWESDVELSEVDVVDFNETATSGISQYSIGAALYFRDNDWAGSHYFTWTDSVVQGNGGLRRDATGIAAHGAAGAGDPMTSAVDNVQFLSNGPEPAFEASGLSVVYLDAGVLDVTGSAFDGNLGTAIRVRPVLESDLLVSSTTFTENEAAGGGLTCAAGICVEEPDEFNNEVYDYAPVRADVTVLDSAFTDNVGDEAADIWFDNRYGMLDVADTDDDAALPMTFSGFTAPFGDAGSVAVMQGSASFDGAQWAGPFDVDGLGRDHPIEPQRGGAITFEGHEMWCTDCTIDGTAARAGGAVAIRNSTGIAPWVVFDGGSVANSFADLGGAFHQGAATHLELHGTSVDNTAAEGGGAYFAGAYGELAPTGIVAPAELVAVDCAVEATQAVFGGAFFLAGGGTVASFDACDFTANQSTFGVSLPFNEQVGAIAGFGTVPGGGVGYLMQNNGLSIHGGAITGSQAEGFGGVLFSENAFIGQRASIGTSLEGGNDVVLEGVTQSGAEVGAELQDAGVGSGMGSVAMFGLGDHVRVHGSEFRSNIARGAATFAFVDADRVEMSCNEFCGNSVQGPGTVAAFFDQGALSSFSGIPTDQFGQTIERPKDVRYEFSNNVVQDNQSSYGQGGVLSLDLERGPDEPDTGLILGGTADTAWDTFDTSGASYDDGSRGRLTVLNNTFVGNHTEELPALVPAGDIGDRRAVVAGSAGDVKLDLTNNIFQDGPYGVVLQDSLYLFGGWNMYTGQGTGDADAPYYPTATEVTGPPVYRDYTPGTCGGLFYLEPGSPGLNEGSPEYEDWDQTVSNLGAFGGPGACIPDADSDGANAIIDCNDDDQTIYPDHPSDIDADPAPEVPYDGIDQDCDGADLCDVDGDGFDADFGECTGDDCNDADASINPDAIDIPYNGIDEDCDGADLCDVDGDGYLADNDACGGLDCNDDDPDTYPGAPEIPDDGIDQDCDGSDLVCDRPEIPYNGIDEDCDGEDLCDVDGDGFDATAEATDGFCDGQDCDDDDPDTYPGAEEVPYDGVDQDCDGEDLCDADGDGFPAPDCDDDYTGEVDCDDDDPATYPGALDNPLDEIDQDCSGEPAELFVQNGCGCNGTGNTAPWGGLVLLGLALTVSRRRRHDESPAASLEA